MSRNEVDRAAGRTPRDCLLHGCPCGYFGDPTRACTCSPSAITRYQNRISGPLLDRVDIHLEVPRLDYDKMSDRRLGEPSAAIRDRVAAAQEIQAGRFQGSSLTLNRDMGPAQIRDYCRLDEAGDRLMRAAVQQLQLSGRAYHRVLKLARTIADLAHEDQIGTHHLAEAIQYRPKEMVV